MPYRDTSTPTVRTPTDVFKYGDHELAFVLTKEYRHEPVYDPSGTDALYTKHTLRVQGVLYPGLAPLDTASLAVQETAAQKLRRIEHDFMRPRQMLEYSQNGKMILQVDNVDAENGPKPQSFNVSLMTQESVTVEFTIIVCLVGCKSGQASRLGYSSNRWSESEDYDEAAYCTLTTRGLLIVASDLKSNPDALRDVVAPVIRRGYKRMSSNYTLSEDGLRLAYSFVDKEFYLGPPLTARKASGRFMIIMLPGQYVAQCTVRLEGDKLITKRDLMASASRIVLSKMTHVALSSNKAPIVTNASYQEELFENVVEISFRCRISDHKSLGTTVSGVRLDLFGSDLPGCIAQNQPGIAPRLRGNNDFLQLLCATFNDPCVMQSVLEAGGMTQAVVYGAGGAPPLGETSLSSSGGTLADAIARGAKGETAYRSQSAAQVLAAASGNRSLVPPGPGDRVATVHPTTYNPVPRQGTNPASIIVGAIPPPPAANAPTQIPYEQYEVRISYLNKTGFDVLASSWFDSTKIGTTDPASPYNKAGFAKNKKVRSHGPIITMVVDWNAERVGTPPEIPDPCPSHENEDDCNYVLIESGITLDQLEAVLGAGYRHRATGKYVYKVLDTTKVPLAAALPPFIQAEVIEKINAANGTLNPNSLTATDRTIANLDNKLAEARTKLDKLYLDYQQATNKTELDIIALQIKGMESLIRSLEANRSTAIDKAANGPTQSTSTTGTAVSVKKTRKDGDYTLNPNIIFFRLNTLKPGPTWEDCPCDDSTTGATLTASQGFEAFLTGGNTPRVLPNP